VQIADTGIIYFINNVSSYFHNYVVIYPQLD